MLTIIQRFFNISDKQAAGNFEFYLISCLTFSLVFRTMCC